jgi:CheY-like chemotaxis protein
LAIINILAELSLLCLYLASMGKHIVIIEDDLIIAAVIKELLTEQGYLATSLPSLSTIESLMDLNADCFIIDEQLPFVSGHIICIMLKSKPGTKDIPIILVSASDELEGYASLYKADAFFKKPFVNIHDLITLVASTLQSVQLGNKLSHS